MEGFMCQPFLDRSEKPLEVSKQDCGMTQSLSTGGEFGSSIVYALILGDTNAGEAN